jgi:hypothetical protein
MAENDVEDPMPRETAKQAEFFRYLRSGMLRKDAAAAGGPIAYERYEAMSVAEPEAEFLRLKRIADERTLDSWGRRTARDARESVDATTRCTVCDALLLLIR